MLISALILKENERGYNPCPFLCCFLQTFRDFFGLMPRYWEFLTFLVNPNIVATSTPQEPTSSLGNNLNQF